MLGSINKNLLYKLHITYLAASVFLFVSLSSMAQTAGKHQSTLSLQQVQKQYRLDPESPLLSRVAITPDDVLKMFRDAGMSPTPHKLTTKENTIVANAFAALPPLHQHVLKQRLKSISFLDNMPNTALTSPVTKDGEPNLYHITFRAGILHQNISEWVTEKELTCFAGSDSSISVSIQAGLLSALTYVMLHEGTHVVDGSLHLIGVDTISRKAQPNNFTTNFAKGVWKNINTPDFPFKDSTVVKSRFRPGGRRFSYNEAATVYTQLSQTPFVSFYSTASWHEDLAELLTIYHLTQKIKQPFRVIVKQNGKEVTAYQPINNPLIQARTPILHRFYKEK